MQFWKQLSLRERFIIGYSVPLVILAAGYLYYWQPMAQDIERLRTEIPQKAAVLAWAEHEIDNASAWLENDSSTDAQKPILTIIESHAIESEIKNAIQRVQPDKQQIKLWFRDVVADHWFEFVKGLAFDGISVVTAALTRSKDGKINVRVTFTR